jgi:hypothetical protein
MEQYRLAILLKEFSFIEAVAKHLELDLEKDLNEIKIRRGDKMLLSKKGNEDLYDWSGGGHYDYTKYFAIWTDADGEYVIQLDNAGRSATGSGERHDWDADSIGEQLFVKKIVPDYIVECVKNDTDDNGNGEVRRSWTIHKMRKFDLAAHHQQKIDETATALKAEIAAACAE